MVVASLLGASCADDGGSTEPAAPDSTTSTTTTSTSTVTEPPSTTAPTTTPVPTACPDPATCPLARLADEAGVLLGVASSPDRLDDPGYVDTLTTHFNSITAQNAMKWDALHPEPGVYDFTSADALMTLAAEHDLEVKGHTLIWAQDLIDATPDWVEEITDPDELRALVREHFETVLGHFGDRVDRWDVVNEPLATLGTEVHVNHFHRVLGPGYIDEVFRLADEISPNTRLFLNEAGTETIPAKADAFVEFVTGMVERGVPIDGVGLQGHLLVGVPEEGELEELISRFVDLGLEVAITELDIVAGEGPDRFEVQAERYARVVRECLAAGCREVTVWGVDDGHTWLTSLLDGIDSAPLLFDAELQPKPAVEAIRAELAAMSEP
jgi:endo-1,4-beta-xylanase